MAEASPARAKFECGNGRMEEIRLAADAPVGMAGRRGNFATTLVGAGILALSRKGAWESLCELGGAGCLGAFDYEYSRPLFLASTDGLPASCGTTQSVSRFTWDDEALRPTMLNGGASFPDAAVGLYQWGTPRHFDVCKAVLLKDTVGSSDKNARGVVRELRGNLLLKRILVDAEGAI